MERARTEWLRGFGYALDEIEKQYGFVFAVRTAHVEYVRPARLNDLVRVQVKVSRLGRASVDIEQGIYREQQLICHGHIKLAGLDAVTLRPMAIPISLE
jgi:acyl-CoA thioester hydrolase